MKKINFLLALFMLISVSFNTALAADNYKLHNYRDADSDAALLLAAGPTETYPDIQTAQKAIYHNDVATPWRFGTYEFATDKFVIYSDLTASWSGTQWVSSNADCPIVFEGQSFVNNANFSPVIFFVAPSAAIYKVSASFQYQSDRNNPTTGSSLYQFKAKDGSKVVNMNFGKNYTDHTVLNADFYVNLHAGDTITFNQTCTQWGDPFCVWTKLEVLGNDNGIAFTSTEANLSGFYFDNYLVKTDFSFLNAKIAESEALIASTEQNSFPGTFPPYQIAKFQPVIDAAKNLVLNQPNATQLEINAQLASLTAAYAVFLPTFIITPKPDAANNYKLFGYGDTDSDAQLLVNAGTYGNPEIAQKAIVHNEIASPWKFGTYDFATQKFLIYSDATANWVEGKQWGSLNNDCPIVFDGHTFVFAADFSPVIFFVAPKAAIYLVSTNFQYKSTLGSDTSGSDFFQFKSNDGTPLVDMNFGGSYDQTSPIIPKDFFVNMHVGDTISFNQTATVWGDPFCQWVNLQVLGNENGNAYTQTMASNSGIYFNYYPVVNGIDKTQSSTLKIMTVDNGIRVITDKAAPVTVYNIAGMAVKTCFVNSDEVISLTQGAYIVKSGNIIQKVIVK